MQKSERFEFRLSKAERARITLAAKTANVSEGALVAEAVELYGDVVIALSQPEPEQS